MFFLKKHIKSLTNQIGDRFIFEHDADSASPLIGIATSIRTFGPDPNPVPPRVIKTFPGASCKTKS